MKNVKLFSLILCIFLCITLLAGCGDKQSQATATATPTPTSSNNEPTPTPELIYMKPGDTYRYYSWDFTTETQYLEGEGIRGEHIRTRYNEMKETYGINIEFVISIGTAWGWMDAPLEAAYSGKPITEVMNAGGPFTLIPMYMYQGMPGSALAPLDQFPEVATFSDPEYWDVETQNSNSYFGGKLYYAIPSRYGAELCASNMVTIFNKEMLAEKGYTAEKMYNWSKNGEWTWEKFEEVAIAVSDETTGVKAVAAGQNYPILWTLVATNGGDFIAKRDVNGVMKDRFTLNEEKSIKAWDFFIKLSRDLDVVEQYKGTHETVDFAKGKVAMMLTNVGLVENVSELSDGSFTWGVIMPPKGPDATDYISDVNWFTPVCMMQNVANPQGTVQFIEKFFAPPYGATSQESLELLDIELTPFLHDQESLQTCIDVIGKTHPTAYMTYHALSNYEVRDYMWGTQMINGMIKGETTPATYFASVKDVVDAIIDDALSLQDQQ